eukprot:TRINITY_DN3554_c1_g1_i1.p1 TRINITY_DN3554_c1_g1~~TRINITY_DN3554_c1_g1_i1.p1  ORF type:complete len:145 (-),score=49.96 TRINITY_DN3554_c1_g1_i1:173-607(-)
MAEWNTNEVINYMFYFQVGGSLLMAFLGYYGKKDIFLFVGNLICSIGSFIWVFMLLDFEASDFTLLMFGLLGILNGHVVFHLIGRFKREGNDDDEEEEDEELTQEEWEEARKEYERRKRKQAKLIKNAAKVKKSKKKPSSGFMF